jgi:hypothetical protein
MSYGGFASKKPDSVKSTWQSKRYEHSPYRLGKKVCFQVSLWILTEMIVIGNLKYLYI